MLNINATVINHGMTMTNASGGVAPTLPTGSSGVDAISFAITGAEWTGATLYAYFWQDPGAVYKVTVSNSAAEIPAEVLITPGVVYVALAGDKTGGARISTNACLFTAEQGALTAESAPAPTHSMFEAAVDAAVAEITADVTAAVSSRINALSASATAEFPVVLADVTSWAIGAINSSGAPIDSTKYLRSAYRRIRSRQMLYLPDTDWRIKVFCYTTNSESGFVKSIGYQDASEGIIVDPFSDGGDIYRTCVCKKDGSVLSDADKNHVAAAFQFRLATDTSLSSAGYPADAAAAASRIKNRISSLDELAWGGKTYRDIFVNGDLLHGEGLFESGSLDYWTVQGEPSLLDNDGNHVLDCSSTGETCRVRSASFTVPAAARRSMFVAVKANVLSVSDAGSRGFGVSSSSSESYGGLPYTKGLVTTVTNGYITLGGVYAYTSGITSGYQDMVYIGNNGTGISGHAAYDNAVWINLYNVFGASAPTEDEMLELYETFVAYVSRFKPAEVKSNLSPDFKSALLAYLRCIPTASAEGKDLFIALESSLT